LLSLIEELLPASAGQNNKLPQDPGGKGATQKAQQTEQFEFANRHEIKPVPCLKGETSLRE
jgi:hypothetical protein